MATVLLANEFGAGLGHLTNLEALAQRFDDSHSMVFAVQDPALAAPMLHRSFGAKVRVVQGPTWQPVHSRSPRQGNITESLADPFELLGFGAVDRLLSAVGLWTETVQRHRPDLIISDASPSLRIAMAGRIPMIVVGGGYMIPPARQMLPPIRPWDSVVSAATRAVEARLLTAINETRAGMGGAAVDYFADVFHGDDTFVCSLPNLDPYRGYRKCQSLWPYVLPQMIKGPPVAQRRGPDIFAYLPADHFALEPVLTALGRAGVGAQIYVQGADPHVIAARCKNNVAIRKAPADLATLLPECKLVIHHGGLITAHASLATGAPQLVLPMRLEHAMTSQSLVDCGVAIALPRSTKPDLDTIEKAIKSLQRNEAYHSSAADQATLVGQKNNFGTLDQIWHACLKYLHRDF